jgi:hypothetical protein
MKVQQQRLLIQALKWQVRATLLAERWKIPADVSLQHDALKDALSELGNALHSGLITDKIQSLVLNLFTCWMDSQTGNSEATRAMKDVFVVPSTHRFWTSSISWSDLEEWKVPSRLVDMIKHYNGRLGQTGMEEARKLFLLFTRSQNPYRACIEYATPFIREYEKI